MLKRTLMIVGGVCLTMAGAAHAENYRATQWLPSGEPLAAGLEWFSKEVTSASNGEVTFEFFGVGSLVPAKATLQSVADGVAHVGFAYSGYTPSEAPVTEAIANFSFVDVPFNVLTAAYADFVSNDPDGYQDWRKHKVIPLGGWETPKYDLLCNTEPLSSLSDLKGKRVRFPGGPMSEFGAALGLVPVNIPSSEAYQAQQTGQTNCSNVRPSSLIDIPMLDITKSITRLRTGMTFASPTVVFNETMWKGVTSEQRRLIFDLTARMMARQQIHYLVGHEKALAKAAEDGIALVEPDDEVKATIANWVDNHWPAAVETSSKTHGIADPQALFDRFQTYIDKWEPIIAGVKDNLDEEELTAVFKEHLFDKLDADTYGME